MQRQLLSAMINKLFETVYGTSYSQLAEYLPNSSFSKKGSETVSNIFRQLAHLQ